MVQIWSFADIANAELGLNKNLVGKLENKMDRDTNGVSEC